MDGLSRSSIRNSLKWRKNPRESGRNNGVINERDTSNQPTKKKKEKEGEVNAEKKKKKKSSSKATRPQKPTRQGQAHS